MNAHGRSLSALILHVCALSHLNPSIVASHSVPPRGLRGSFLIHSPALQAMSSSHGTPASRPLPSFQATYSLGPDSPLPMPAVGLGTFQVKEQAGYEAVKAAIKVRKFTGSESAIRIVTGSATHLGCKTSAWKAVSRDAHPPPTRQRIRFQGPPREASCRITKCAPVTETVKRSSRLGKAVDTHASSDARPEN